MGIITDSLNEEQVLLARAQRFATDQLQDHPDGSLLPRLLQAHQFALAITSQEAQIAHDALHLATLISG